MRSLTLNQTNLNESESVLGGMEFISKDLWLFVPYLSLFSVGILAGVVGNLLIIGTILNEKDLRKNPTFIMILNLSVSDLAVSLWADTFTYVGTLVGKKFFDAHPFWCQFAGAVCLIACGTSLVSMGFLAVNRYVCIIHPNFYKKMFTMNKTICYCLLGWATGVAFNIPNFIPGWAEYNFDAKEFTCSSDRTKKVYATVFASAGILLPCSAMGACYLHIFCYAYRAKAKFTGRSKADAFRLAKSLFASFTLFFVCWIPHSIIILIDGDNRLSTAVHMYLFALAHLNSAMNPIFYAVFNPKIKESYQRFLHFASFGLFFSAVDRRKSSVVISTHLARTKSSQKY